MSHPSELHYSNEEGVEADEGIARKAAPAEKPVTDAAGTGTAMNIHMKKHVGIDTLATDTHCSVAHFLYITRS